MSDNEDLLGDDLNDHSLADYTLGNDEEDELLADDHDPQSVPESEVQSAEEAAFIPPPASVAPKPVYHLQPEYGESYKQNGNEERVVPNVTEEDGFNKYGERIYEKPAAEENLPDETEIIPPVRQSPIKNVESEMSQERFPDRSTAVRVPQVRDIPDSLDKVYIPGQNQSRHEGRTWRNPHYSARFHNQNHPYRRVNPRHTDFLRPQIPPTDFGRSMPQRPQQRPFQGNGPPMQRPQMPQQVERPPRPEQMERPPRPQQMERPPMPQQIQRPPMPQQMERPPIPHQMQRQPMQQQLQRPPMHQQMDRPPMHQHMERPPMHQQMERPPMHQQMERPPFPNPVNPQFNERFPTFQPNQPRFGPIDERPQFRPSVNTPLERPIRGPNNFRPMFRPPFDQSAGPQIINHPPLPQITIRQSVPMLPMIEVPNVPMSAELDLPPPPGVGDFPPKVEGLRREQEVRMLPLQIPQNLPLTGKKVLINPHFKGNIQPPIEGLTYIPTRIEKPTSPTLEKKFGPIKDIDDAAERFIAEQRSALARRKRRSPQRYLEDMTVRVDNDLPLDRDRELLRRQEEFINANRAGLRRRMRSPTPPPRRSPSPPRRRLPSPPPVYDNSEESEYQRRLRDQETMRERVLRAKEVRRRKNAVTLQRQIEEREREKEREKQQERDKSASQRPRDPEQVDKKETEVQKAPVPKPEPVKADTVSQQKEKGEKKVETKKIEKVKEPEIAKVEKRQKTPEFERDLTPPLPAPVEKKPEDDFDYDALDLIIDELDGILSDDDDSGRFKEKAKPISSAAPPAAPKPADLRSKLPAKDNGSSQRQKITFGDGERQRRERTPPLKRAATPERRQPPNKTARPAKTVRPAKSEPMTHETESQARQRQKIVFGREEEAEKPTPQPKISPSIQSRRVVIQRKIQPAKPIEKSVFSRIEKADDPTKPTAGIFSRAVRTIGQPESKRVSQAESKRIGQPDSKRVGQPDSKRIVVPKAIDEAKVEVQMDSDDESLNEDFLLRDDDDLVVATVTNLPHGMTDARLKTLAGTEVQSLYLDNERRSAKITFKTHQDAEGFKKKFNNKMVAASRLTVVLQ